MVLGENRNSPFSFWRLGFGGYLTTFRCLKWWWGILIRLWEISDPRYTQLSLMKTCLWYISNKYEYLSHIPPTKNVITPICHMIWTEIFVTEIFVTKIFPPKVWLLPCMEGNSCHWLRREYRAAFEVDCDAGIGRIGKFNFKVYHSPDPLRLYPLEINHSMASSKLEN